MMRRAALRDFPRQAFSGFRISLTPDPKKRQKSLDSNRPMEAVLPGVPFEG